MQYCILNAEISYRKLIMFKKLFPTYSGFDVLMFKRFKYIQFSLKKHFVDETASIKRESNIKNNEKLRVFCESSLRNNYEKFLELILLFFRKLSEIET